MGREKIVDVILLKDKRRYMMSVVDKEGEYLEPPKIDIKGIEIVSTRTPQHLKKPLKVLCMDLLQKDSEKDFREQVKKFYDIWAKMDLEDRSLPRSVRNFNDYKPSINGDFNITWASGTPSHLKAAILYNHICKVKKLNKQPILEGGKIKFVYLKKDNPYRLDTLGYPDKFPYEFEMEQYIDYDKMWEMTVVRALDGVSKILNYKSLLEDDMIEENIW